MTNEQAIIAVSEALEMGLFLSIKGPNGDNVLVGPSSVVRRSKAKREIIFEYGCKQTLGSYISRNKNEIAALAVECGGRKIGNEARRLVAMFVIDTKNRLS